MLNAAKTKPPTTAKFDDQSWYRADDPLMQFIGSKSTLAHWRIDGRGPPFKKMAGGKGSRIIYSGEMLNQWLSSLEDQPRKMPTAA